MVRPVLTHGVAAWYSPERKGSNPVARAIQTLQNQGLYIVAGAYKATLVRELEKETFIPPIELYCNELRA